MSNSNSRLTRHGFKHRLHFLRLEGERDLDIGNPIVAFEDGYGNFSPRHPEPGETHAHAPSFNSDEELTTFLLDREENHVDHDKLFKAEHESGIGPYQEFVTHPEDSEACIQPGLPSIGGWQRYRAFHHSVSDEILDTRSWKLLLAEIKSAWRTAFIFSSVRPPAEHDTEADLGDVIARLKHGRGRRRTEERKPLPPGTARFYRDAQNGPRRFAGDPGAKPDLGPAAADDWS